MKMSCFRCVKVTMIIFNMLIFLSGTALLAVGVWVTVNKASFLSMLGPLSAQATQFANIGVLCIATGLVLFLLGFLGCCGAYGESKCLILMFFVVLLIISIAEVAGGIVLLADSSLAKSILTDWAAPALKTQYGTDPDVTQIWNATMTELSCCGVTNYTDFTNSSYEVQHGGSYPPACCAPGSAQCNLADAEAGKVVGCFEKLLSVLRTNVGIVGGVAVGIFAIELTAMTASMYLYCKIDKGFIH
ncbi:tetraspanin-1-like [Brienomyrus brachyistius]|uniref:tetraspanin-1-like n=1 Tax=Brienomyrus brachyistius TaxID=42636 RepID=UPI0020B3CAAA|nr:tetraspanin-1-like [Brienomyrus brachyistius]